MTTAFEQRLEQELRDMAAALVSVRGRAEDLKTLRGEADLLLAHSRKRLWDCEAAGEQSSTRVQSQAWSSRKPLPEAVEKAFEGHYVRERERAEQDLELARKLRAMAYEPAT